jgi:hypothetical protein
MVASINASTSAGVVTTADTSGILQLQTASTAAVTVDASQNVGIGTTSPLRKFHVKGSGNTSQFESTSSSGYVYIGDSASSAIDNQGIGTVGNNLSFLTGGSERMRIDSSGNVGIGVTPSATGSGKALEIGTVGNTLWGIGAADLQISAGTYYNGGNKYAVTGSAVSAYELVSGSHRWYYAASGTAGNTASFSESMRIDSSGNLLLGTTSQITSGLICAAANLNNLYPIVLKNTVTQAGGHSYMYFVNSANAKTGSIDHTGTTTVAYTTSSDYRMKENIAPMTGALTAVLQLKPCTYTWKEDGKVGQGFIAHELQKVCPDCVSGEKDAIDEHGNPEYQGIDTSFLVATLTAAIQELKVINDTQAELISGQAATINALVTRIEALENRA